MVTNTMLINPNQIILRKREIALYVANLAIMHLNAEKERNDNPPKPKTNLGEGDEQVIVAIVSQVNMVTNIKEWVVDSGATRHICANKESFSTYTVVEDGKEVVYLGDSRTAKVLGKGKVLLKLNSGKTLALSELLHVPNIRANLISAALLI